MRITCRTAPTESDEKTIKQFTFEAINEKDRPALLALANLFPHLLTSNREHKPLKRSKGSTLMHATLSERNIDLTKSAPNLKTPSIDSIALSHLKLAGIPSNEITDEQRSNIFKILYDHYSQLRHFWPQKTTHTDGKTVKTHTTTLADAAGNFFTSLRSSEITEIRPDKTHEEKLQEIQAEAAKESDKAQEFIFVSTNDLVSGIDTYSFLFHPHNAISRKLFGDMVVEIKKLLKIDAITYKQHEFESLVDSTTAEEIAKLPFTNGSILIKRYSGNTLEKQETHSITIAFNSPDKANTATLATPQINVMTVLRAFEQLLTDKYQLPFNRFSTQSTLSLYDMLNMKIGTGYLDYTCVPVKFNVETNEAPPLLTNAKCTASTLSTTITKPPAPTKPKSSSPQQPTSSMSRIRSSLNRLNVGNHRKNKASTSTPSTPRSKNTNKSSRPGNRKIGPRNLARSEPSQRSSLTSNTPKS